MRLIRRCATSAASSGGKALSRSANRRQPVHIRKGNPSASARLYKRLTDSLGWVRGLGGQVAATPPASSPQGGQRGGMMKKSSVALPVEPSRWSDALDCARRICTPPLTRHLPVDRLGYLMDWIARATFARPPPRSARVSRLVVSSTHRHCAALPDLRLPRNSRQAAAQLPS
jgi:hypothetical protein